MILTPRPSDIEKISYYDDEAEVLFNQGTKFNVKDYKTSVGERRIGGREVETTYHEFFLEEK